MKNHHVLGITIVAALVLGVAIFAWPDDAVAPAPGEETATSTGLVATSSPDIGLSFSHPPSYKVTVRDVDLTRRIHRQIELTEGEAVQNGEGPTAITVDVYQNDLDGETARGFITGHSDSNYKLGDGVIATTTYGSLEGLEYTWSGLYEGRSFVVARPDWIYMFSVTRLEPTDKILGDFEALLRTVRIAQ